MADYLLEGQKWGLPTFGTPGSTVTWAVDASVPAFFAASLNTAFDDWAAYGNISFRQVGSLAESDIDIRVAAIDGPNNVLGRADYSYIGASFLSATVTFDSAEGWHTAGNAVLSDSGASLLAVALHEVGHAIGLDHYDERLAIMNTLLEPDFDGLTLSDIFGVEAIYGPSEARIVDLVMHNGASIAAGTVASGSTSYKGVGGFGAEWDLIGFGQFDGGPASEFLIHSAGSHEIRLGRADGQTATHVVGAVGAEWLFQGSADYTGDGRADLLMRNSAGTLSLASVSDAGGLQYSQIGSIGSEWLFGRTDASGELANRNGVSGDFLGTGRDGFVMYSLGSHDMTVVEVVEGRAVYTAIGQVGTEWKLLASGDFVGDSRDDFLIYNTGSHTIQAVSVTNGTAAYTTIGAVGPEWEFVGAGDFDGDGRDGALMHRVAADGGGWLQELEVVDGHATYTTIGAVGSEWDLIA
jgi:hypothetical protein